MTEQEWLACTELDGMLRLLQNKVSDRQVLHVACELCRRVAGEFTLQWSKEALILLEQKVDGMVTVEEMEKHRSKCDDTAIIGDEDEDERVGHRLPADGVAYLCFKHSIRYSSPNQVPLAFYFFFGQKAASEQEKCLLLRDIFGNPFRPVTVSSAWQTTNVVMLAQTIYDERAFNRMPILADALEDAGCDNADILNHCRQPGDHVRGCWAVDLVLGKQ